MSGLSNVSERTSTALRYQILTFFCYWHLYSTENILNASTFLPIICWHAQNIFSEACCECVTQYEFKLRSIAFNCIIYSLGPSISNVELYVFVLLKLLLFLSSTKPTRLTFFFLLRYAIHCSTSTIKKETFDI